MVLDGGGVRDRHAAGRLLLTLDTNCIGGNVSMKIVAYVRHFEQVVTLAGKRSLV